MPVTNFVNQFRPVLARLDEATRTDGSPQVYCVVGSPGVGKTAVVVHWAHLHKEHTPTVRCSPIFAASIQPVHQPYLARCSTASWPRSDWQARSREARWKVVPRRIARRCPLAECSSYSTTRLMLARSTAVPGRGEHGGAHQPRHVAGADGQGGSGCPGHPAFACFGGPGLAGPAHRPRACRHRPGRRGAGPSLRLPATGIAIAGERVASGYYARVADLVEELSNEADVLDALDTDDEATALRVVFSVSYRHLTPDQRRTFRFLGWHPA